MTTRTRRGAAACAAALLAGLIAAGAPVAAAGAPVAAAGTGDDPGLEQTVDADETVVDGGVVVDDGHVDVGPKFVDGTWTMLARDDREVPSVWRDPERTVLHLDDTAVLPAPDSPDFEFLGVDPGTPLHVVPQTQATDVPWLGWNTQDPQVVDAIGQGATLRLDAVDGPGEVFVFLQEGVTGPPNVLWDSGEPLPQELWMEVNTHVHANWVFTEPGVYRLDVTMLADLTDGTTAQDDGTLVFAVGQDTDAQAALAAASGDEPGAGGGASDGPSDRDDPGTSTPPGDGAGAPDESPSAIAGAAAPQAGPVSGGGPGWLVWAGAGAGLVLALVLLARVVRTRRARAAADHDVEGES